jgi:hypothetical protein
MRPRLQQTLREGGSFGRVPIVPIVPEPPFEPPNGAIVTNGTAALNAEDWQAHFEQPAAMREFDGGFTRPAAEAHGLQNTIALLGPARSARHGKLH